MLSKYTLEKVDANTDEITMSISGIAEGKSVNLVAVVLGESVYFEIPPSAIRIMDKLLRVDGALDNLYLSDNEKFKIQVINDEMGTIAYLVPEMNNESPYILRFKNRAVEFYTKYHGEYTSIGILDL